MTVTPMGHGRPPWGGRRKMRMVNKLTYLGRRFPALRPGCALLIAWRASYSEKRHVGFGEVLDCLKYNITPQEYALYGFAGRSPAEKKQYLSTGDRVQLIERLNRNNNAKLLITNKYMTYLVYRKYYKRDVVFVGGPDGSETYDRFLKQHGSAVYKPLGEACGKGVMRVADGERNDDTFRQFMQNGPFVLEEAIDQADDMASFHPESVNTIRVVTHYNRKTDTCTVLFALLRVGAGSSIVDNYSAGGVIASVDITSGAVDSPGYRQDKTWCEAHPDTHHPIRHARIPQWSELLETVEQVARVLPDIPLVGWDFALSKRGWCIVEANTKPSFKISQMLQNRGMRPLLSRLLEEA